MQFYTSEKPDRVLSCNLKNSQETFDSKDEIELEIKITVEFSSTVAYYVFKFPALNFKDFLPAFYPASWRDTVPRPGKNKFSDVHWVDGKICREKCATHSTDCISIN